MNEEDIGKVVQSVLSNLYKTGPAAEKTLNEKDNVLRVAIGSDHGGFDAKESLKKCLTAAGYHITDVGTFSKDSVDYPDFAVKVAEKVAGGECERGIMIDGAGIGSSIVCNKVRGIRAALCYDLTTIKNSREHNNANVLTLGGPMHTADEICEMAKLWLETRFAGGRHWARINKMMAVERDKL
ncbi:MAG: ribose 5-phosphate isomerase B [Spirochaetales bacterium]|nr:ribose 5-phosphate isomerase B [Spirochaetales bacterium]